MRLFSWFCIPLLVTVAAFAGAAEPQRLVVSVPGPRNISYLPIDLIAKIGADRQVGARLELLHTGGGGVALNNLITRNADFAVAGLPAAMSLRANGGDVVCIAPVDDRPLFVLMVRSGLRREVQTIADLKGKVLGVNTSTRSSKTTSQQLLELLLQSGGVASDAVRIVPAGQSWDEQASILLTGAADAVMGDEPYATRLHKEGKVFVLANLGDPALAPPMPGADFLHAAVETRGDVITREPEKVERMVRMLQITLQWMGAHTPAQIVDKLGVTDPVERASLVNALAKYPRAYSRDGRFSSAQLRHTQLFFRAATRDDARAQSLEIKSMVDDRWAGLRS